MFNRRKKEMLEAEDYLTNLLYKLGDLIEDCKHNIIDIPYKAFDARKVQYAEIADIIIELFPKKYKNILDPILKEIDYIYMDINDGNVIKDTVYLYAIDFLSSYFFTLEKIIKYNHKK